MLKLGKQREWLKTLKRDLPKVHSWFERAKGKQLKMGYRMVLPPKKK